MRLFYDTSAWVPLIIEESTSGRMWDVKMQAEEIWAWSWMQVETEATLVRRKAGPDAWRLWQVLKRDVNWVDLEPEFSTSLCMFNRALGLRAADAGHLFVYTRVFAQFPEVRFLCLDQELCAAAHRIAVPVFTENS